MITKIADGFAGATWLASAALVVQTAQYPSDLLDWILKGIIVSALTLLGYFIKETAKMIKEKSKQVEDHEARLKDHDLIIQLWAESLGKELDARGGHIGRRHTDVALANLVTAIRRIQNGENNI